MDERIENNIEHKNSSEKSLLKSIMNWSVPLIVLLLPIFFFPALVNIYSAKVAILVIFGLVATVSYLATLLVEGELCLPRAPFLLALVGVAVVSVLSSVFTGALVKSFGGSVIEVDSAFFWVIGATLAVVASLSITNIKQIYVSTIALISASAVVLLAIFVKILAVYGLLPASLLTFIPDSLSITMIDALIILGAATIASFNLLSISIQQRYIRIGLWVVMVCTLVLAGAMNFLPVIVALAVFAAMHFVYTVTISGQAGGERKKMPFASLFVLVVSALLLFGGATLSGFLSNTVKVASFDVRPTVGTTASLTLNSWKSNPVFGIGPNKFSNVWNSNKPAGVNLTTFWSADFNSGFGYLPTAVLEMGILGLLAVLAFLGLFLWTGFKSIFSTFENPSKRFLLISLFFVAIYFWAMAVAYAPSISVLGLAFLETGIFAAALSIAGNTPRRVINLFSNSRTNFISVFAIVVFILITIAGGYFAGRKIIASSIFDSGVSLINSGGSADEGLAQLGRAYAIAPSDIYARAISRVYVAKLQASINTFGSRTNITDEEKAGIQTMVAGAVASSRDAIALDGKSYQNWASLGLVYETLAQIKVEGALSAAKDAYNQAKVLAPSNPSVPLALARLAVLEGDAKGALSLADEAIALKQNYTDAYFLKAQIEVSQNDIAGAIKSVEDATIIDPTNAGLYFQLGLLKYNVKDFRGAGIAFENAIRIVPDYANAKYFLGLSYDQLGMRKEAIVVFEDIQKANPDNAEINLILTNLKADKAPFAEAKPPVDTKPQSRKTLPVDESQ